MKRDLEKLKELDREIILLSHAAAALGWDQETYMPVKSIDERAEQLSVLGGIIHEKSVDPVIGRLLDELGASDDNPLGSSDLPSTDRALLRVVGRRYKRATRLPKRLITELTRESSLAQAVWAQARQENDFPKFAPHLDKLIALTREKADCLGYSDHPYDALIDEYEPWMKTSRVKALFADLEPALKNLIRKIKNAPQVDDSFLMKNYPVGLQESFGKAVLTDMGFDFTRGRLDVSAHPFTTTLGGDDVRLTTRYSENYFKTALFGSIHEGGHGLYELGFDDAFKQSSLADGTSLGIHESQSRFWENMIGRSLQFWSYYYPRLSALFPENLSGVSLPQFHKAINKVEPSLIRVEADEVTYGLHIILRFRLELELITGELKVRDLPSRWNEESGSLLGIVPANDVEGVLQDVHWSIGAIGYFPTYALGNLYAAQFHAAMKNDIPDIGNDVRDGRLSVVLDWLRNKIHRHGSSVTAAELCKNVTGADPDPGFFIRYIEEKFGSIYGL